MSPKLDDEEDSTLEEVIVPEFKSNLPGFLADSLDARDKHVLEALSIIAQKQDFLVTIIIRQNRVIRKVEARTNRYEKLKLMLTSKWGIIVTVIMFIAPVFLTKLVHTYWP